MVTVTDCNGCKQTDDVNITVYPLPVAEISGEDVVSPVDHK